MIDERKNCVTKSKLKITVKTLSKYNKWEQRCSQRNKQIDSETQKVTKIQAEKHTK